MLESVISSGVSFCLQVWEFFKVEYYADAEYENSIKNSEIIACVAQSLLYLIMEKNNTLSR